MFLAQCKAHEELISTDIFEMEMKSLRVWVLEMQKTASDSVSLRDAHCETLGFGAPTRRIAGDCLELKQDSTKVMEQVTEQINQMGNCIAHRLEEGYEKRFNDMLTAIGAETRARMKQLTETRGMIKECQNSLAILNSDMLEQVNTIRKSLGTAHHSESGVSLKSELANCWQRIAVEKDAIEALLRIFRETLDGEIQARSQESAYASSDMTHSRDSMTRTERVGLGTQSSANCQPGRDQSAQAIDMDEHLLSKALHSESTRALASGSSAPGAALDEHLRALQARHPISQVAKQPRSLAVQAAKQLSRKG